MYQFENVSIWKCVNLKMCQFENVSIWKCVNLKMCQFENVSIWKCINLKMCQFENVSIWKCINLKMCQFENVSIWKWNADYWLFVKNNIKNAEYGGDSRPRRTPTAECCFLRGTINCDEAKKYRQRARPYNLN